MKDWFKRNVGIKNEPKIVLRHRERSVGWKECKCLSCDSCKGRSHWEDNLCIPCFRREHKSNIGEKQEEG
jgi:hypothetical protein